jgi:hypothetical protein
LARRRHPGGRGPEVRERVRIVHLREHGAARVEQREGRVDGGSVVAGVAIDRQEEELAGGRGERVEIDVGRWGGSREVSGEVVVRRGVALCLADRVVRLDLVRRRGARGLDDG